MDSRRKKIVFILLAMAIGLILGMCTLPSVSEGLPPQEDNAKIANKIFEKYRNAKLVEILVSKSIKSEWKTSEQIFEGTIFYSKGKFRWENDKPEKNLTVYNGQTLWNVQYASPDFPGKNKVTKSTISKKNREQILLMSLIDIQDLSEKFNVENFPGSETDQQLVILKLEPKEKDPLVSNLKLTLDKEKKVLLNLTFQDDIGNQTKIQFNKSTFLKKKKKTLFEFIPGKNDEVTQI